jgi:hypothetical protein
MPYAQSTHNKLNPLPEPHLYNGYLCRTNAVTIAAKWLYDSGLVPDYIQNCKGDVSPRADISLRQIAKQEFHSAIGEIYNINDLSKIARRNPGVYAKPFHPTNLRSYTHLITRAIDNNMAPIVFFDMDGHTGLPIKANGVNEHAAVVTGYKTDANLRVYGFICERVLCQSLI